MPLSLFPLDEAQQQQLAQAFAAIEEHPYGAEEQSLGAAPAPAAMDPSGDSLPAQGALSAAAMHAAVPAAEPAAPQQQDALLALLEARRQDLLLAQQAQQAQQPAAAAAAPLQTRFALPTSPRPMSPAAQLQLPQAQPHEEALPEPAYTSPSAQAQFLAPPSASLPAAAPSAQLQQLLASLAAAAAAQEEQQAGKS